MLTGGREIKLDNDSCFLGSFCFFLNLEPILQIKKLDNLHSLQTSSGSSDGSYLPRVWSVYSRRGTPLRLRRSTHAEELASLEVLMHLVQGLYNFFILGPTFLFIVQLFYWSTPP